MLSIFPKWVLMSLILLNVFLFFLGFILGSTNLMLLSLLNTVLFYIPIWLKEKDGE